MAGRGGRDGRVEGLDSTAVGVEGAVARAADHDAVAGGEGEGVVVHKGDAVEGEVTGEDLAHAVAGIEAAVKGKAGGEGA